MLKRPSSRRQSHAEGIELNLVPILDAMVTLIGFLLFTTSFFSIVGIESLLPQSSPSQVKEQVKEKPLQLTLTIKDGSVLLWSPFKKIEPKTINNLENGTVDLLALHAALIEIKQKFLQENSVVFVPNKFTNYEQLIALMDAVRMLEPTDPPIYIKDEATGLDKAAKLLFSGIVFGNLLGDS